MGAPAPLTLAEFAAALDRIGGFERRPLVAVAVSGGPDSMALAILADRWARERGGAVRALTVDHALRPESAAEARQVASWLAARGIAHETLLWTGEKPRTGIQEAARGARYRLLAGRCAAQGVLHLMTAHQRNDQAETYLIRRRAGSGADGLAGMPAVRELAGCRLLRPLLDVPRARLAAVLAAEEQPFLDDPSNRDPVFERSRVRAATAGSIDAAIAATERHTAMRVARDRELDALLACCVEMHPAGFAAINADAVRAAPEELAERLLARVASCIGALRYPPRRDRVARLRAGLAAAPECGRTLGGCRFLFWRGRILVLRELAAAAPPLRFEPGGDALWDRRFAAALPSPAGPVTLGYRGQFIQKSLPGAGPEERANWRDALPRLLHAVLPATADGTGAVRMCRLGVDGDHGPAVAFRPANPLTDAGFTVV